MADGEVSLDQLRQEEQNTPELREQVKVLQEALSRLQEVRHYRVDTPNGKNTIRALVLACSHIGSLYERVDALTAVHEVAQREKIDTVIVGGDIIDGHGIYRGQEFEVYAHGYDEQEKAVIKKWPKIKGITTYVLAGNHDYSYKRSAGIEVGAKLADVMPGWRYIGQDYASIEFRTGDGRPFLVGVTHPGGGTAYAISYKAQRIAESIAGGRKPDLLVIGHFHKAEFLPAYRNIAILQTGTLQSQTPFMARQGSQAHVGAWIIEAVPGDRKQLTSRIKTEWISFYEPEEVR